MAKEKVFHAYILPMLISTLNFIHMLQTETFEIIILAYFDVTCVTNLWIPHEILNMA